MGLQLLLTLLAGWLARQQQRGITEGQEHTMGAQPSYGGRRLRLTDTARQRRARPSARPQAPARGRHHRYGGDNRAPEVADTCGRAKYANGWTIFV